MEEFDDKNEECRKTVTLILEKKQFKVNKQRLINKSQYFAALLSSNYMEHCQSEHMINYEIPLLPFQNFVEWIHNGKLENFVDHKIDYVLTLLELSILFAVDELTDNIIEKIEEQYLLPNYVINIWLFAQELSLIVLQDLCLATCLDRFTELPRQFIYNLSKENFLKLIANTYLRCNDSYFEDIIGAWNQNHNDILPLSLLHYLELHRKQPKMSYGIVSSENFHINNEVYLHCWNGNKFFELDVIRFLNNFSKTNQQDGKTNKDMIMGMQITGRGCYLYFIGGEFTIGSGKYNRKIWRYSLITKKWLCYADMPTRRRHMIAVFVGNKLLLMGGIGRYRLKLNSIDIYDVHTGVWSQGADMPISFNTVPEYYVFHEKLVIYNNLSYMHLYCPIKNTWSTLCFANIDMYTANVPILPLYGSACYIDIKSNEIIFKSLVKMSDEDYSNFTMLNGTYSKIEMITRVVDDHNPCMMFLCGKIFSGPKLINVALCSDPGFIPRRSRGHRYYLYSLPIQNSNKFHSLFSNTSRRFFDMINPIDLYTQKS